MSHERPQPREVEIALTVHNGLGQTILEALRTAPDHQAQLETLAVEQKLNDHQLRNTIHYLLMADLLSESGEGTLIALTPTGLEAISIISHMYEMADQLAPRDE